MHHQYFDKKISFYLFIVISVYLYIAILVVKIACVMQALGSATLSEKFSVSSLIFS
jgi:hypothetical protein